MKAVTLRKLIVYSLITLSVASGVAFLVSFFYFHDGHLPNVMQESTGRIYESNNHGHMAYLNKAEHYWLVTLQIAIGGLFVFGWILNRKWRVYVHPLEGMTHQQRYNIAQGRPSNKNWDD